MIGMVGLTARAAMAKAYTVACSILVPSMFFTPRKMFCPPLDKLSLVATISAVKVLL